MLPLPVPEKFNTFNTFGIFSRFTANVPGAIGVRV